VSPSTRIRRRFNGSTTCWKSPRGTNGVFAFNTTLIPAQPITADVVFPLVRPNAGSALTTTAEAGQRGINFSFSGEHFRPVQIGAIAGDNPDERQLGVNLTGHFAVMEQA